MPSAERGPSVTDQRQRLVAAFSADLHPFHRDQEFLGHIFATVAGEAVVEVVAVLVGIAGDSSVEGASAAVVDDGGNSPVAFTGPDYATTDLRLTKILRFGERYRLNLAAESFNLLNRDNQRVTITSNGMVNSATTFVTNSVTANIAPTPATTNYPPTS